MRGARAARRRHLRRQIMAVAPDGVFLSNGPGRPGHRPTPTALLQGCWSAERAVLRHLLRQPALRPRARAVGTYKLRLRPPRASTSRSRTVRTGKVEVTAHNHGFAVDAPLDAAGRDAVRRRRGQPRQPQRPTCVEGLRAAGRTAVLSVLGAVPPRGGGRPPRRRLPVRPVRALMASAMGERRASDRPAEV